MISVIIPAFNCSETIVQTLDSVKNQTSISLIKEIIIVNDGSTDNTLEILNKYKNSNCDLPIIILNQKNLGVSAARNKAINLSTQEWIALLDSDDFWLPNKIEVQYEVLKSHPEILFLGTNRNDEYIKIGKLINNSKKIHLLSPKNLLFKSWPSVPTVIFNKDFFSSIGGFEKNMNHGEDADLWLKVARKKQLYYIENSLVLTGFGKNSFGEKGLSANLKEMHNGVNKLIISAYKNRDINFVEKTFFLLYEFIKYIRRILITSRRHK